MSNRTRDSRQQAGGGSSKRAKRRSVDGGPSASEAIQAALARADYLGAADIADSAIAAGGTDMMMFSLSAWRREQSGDFAGAYAVFDQALALAPDDPLILAAIGSTLRREGRLGEALQMLDRAIGCDPRYAVPWLERGYALDTGGSLKAAEESFRRAAALEPSAAAYAGVATAATRQGRWAVGREFADRALGVDAGNVAAHLSLARADIAENVPDQAAERLRALLGAGIGPDERVIALSLLGDATDRLGATVEAFNAYATSNAEFENRHAPLYDGAPRHRDFIERIDAAMTTIDLNAWRGERRLAPAPGQASTHIFLIGHPRSGTTLVENVLASLPNAVALEERPTLIDASRAFLDDSDELARLAALGPDEIGAYRAAYWRMVATCGAEAAGRLFVDMDPLKGARLPLIGTLFPDARIVLMRRDPRDVVWSCFRQPFAVTPIAIEFTDIERAAQHYDAMMRLIERCLAVFPLAVHELRYEALVSDFDDTTKRLCDFVGAAWTPALRDFGATAKRRGVGTASATQLGRGLFDGGRQWRRYQDHLGPALSILQPWVERFGYAD